MSDEALAADPGPALSDTGGGDGGVARTSSFTAPGEGPSALISVVAIAAFARRMVRRH